MAQKPPHSIEPTAFAFCLTFSRQIRLLFRLAFVFFGIGVIAQTVQKPVLEFPVNGTSDPGQHVIGPAVTLRWKTTPSATRYLINWRRLTDNQLFNQSVNSPATSLAVTLLPGHTYRWNMFAYNGNVESPVSDTRYFVVTLPPPTGLSPGTTSETSPPSRTSSLRPNFSWSAVSQASGYIVRISRYPYGEANIIHEKLVTDTSYRLPADILSENGRYRWDVTTLAGDFEGQPANNRYFKAPGHPDAPYSLAGFGFEAFVSLAWNDGSDNEGEFVIERQLASGGVWSEIGRSQADQLAFQDSSAVPGVIYNYRVRASNDWGSSDPSNEVQVARNGSTPAPPVDVLAENRNGAVHVSWRDNSNNETGFEIQRRRISDGALTTFGVTSPATSYDDSSVNVGMTYCYVVSAVNGTGSSTNSAESCVTVRSDAFPKAIIAADDLTPSPGVAVRFRNVGTAGSEYIATWHTGEGEPKTGHDVRITFNSTGAKRVRLTVSRTGFTPSEDTKDILVETAVAGTGQGGSTGNFQSVLGADPVNLASGSYFYQRTDLKLPGIGLPFEFTRHYDSKVNDTNGLPLGYGWNYTPFITVQTNPAGAIVFYGDGHSEVHTLEGGEYKGAPGVFDRLVKNTDDSWQVITKQQTTNHVNAAGQLEFIRDRNGNTIALDYETDPAARGRLKQVTDTVGRVTRFHPYADNPALIGRIEDVLGRSTWFTYDPATTNLVAVTNALNHVTKFTYNVSHQLTDAVDNRGNLIVHNDYDSVENTVTNQVDAFGKTTRFIFDFANHVTRQINALGHEAVYSFDERLLLTNLVDEAGFTTAYEYDDRRNRKLIRDRNGNVAHLTYDERGNVTNKLDALNQTANAAYDERNNPVRRVDALGNELTLGYDGRGNVRFTTNALGFVTEIQYLLDGSGLPEVITDARGFSLTNVWADGNLVETIDALGNKTRMQYDAAGRRTELVDALNRTNRFVFDDADNLVVTVDALGRTNVTRFDANRNPVSSLNPRGAETANIFDLRDRLITTVDAQGYTVTNLHDDIDRKIGIIDQRGNVTRFLLNPIGHLLAVTNALEQTTFFRRDANGNPTNVTDAAGFVTANWYDPLDRLVATVDPNGNTNRTSYDILGRVSATTNELAQVTRFFYDSLNRLTNMVDAAGGTVFFTYDQTGNRLHTTDPNGHTWTNRLDPLGRLIEQITSSGQRTLLSYDAVGNVTNRVTANGHAIGYRYDALNRLTNVVYPDSSTVAFTYDEAGNRTSMVDSVGTTLWSFDLLNRPLSVTDPYGQTVSYRFDATGNRTVLRYPDGKEVLYGYDALNRMESLTNWLGGVVRYLRNPRGLVTHTFNANGTTVDMGYDATGRITGITNWSAAATILASEIVQLDALGNQTNLAGLKPLVPILQSTNVAYTYDRDNRLTSVNGKTATHDGNGNLTGLGSDSYRYDFENRLLSYAVDGVFGGQYRYDGVGNRLQHSTNGVIRRFVLDRAGSLTQTLTETDEARKPIAFYVYGLGLAQRITPDGQTDTYHFDLRGSTVLLTAASGEPVAAYAYDVFGVLSDSDEDRAQPFRYLGSYGIMDDGNGLYHARARYFSPHWGRFVSQDPVWGNDQSSQSWNRYSYALNNPLRMQDTTGRSPSDGVDKNQTSTSALLQVCTTDAGDLIIPSWVDLDEIVRKAQEHRLDPFKLLWFYLQFESYDYDSNIAGPWNFKHLTGYPKTPEWQNFGNFVYGLAGKAAGIPEQTLLRVAGLVQSNPQSNWGHFYNITAPYGDDPVDDRWVRAGFEYFDQQYSSGVPNVILFLP